MESMYLNSKECIVKIDVCIFGGFAMSSGEIWSSTEYLGLPHGATITLHHATPFMFETSMKNKGIQNPSKTAVGYSLGATSACASATDTLILVAPVIDTFERLKNRHKRIENYFQYLHFLITYRKATSHSVLSNLSPSLKRVLFLCASNDTLSPPEYVLELAKKINVSNVKVVKYKGTHNFNMWSDPQIIYEKNK
tara:strand:+ start:123 stop:707 length:585 start_codon:yes stop_codon:yes gene_type:complete